MQNTKNWFFTATKKALNFKLFDISSLRSKTLFHFILVLTLLGLHQYSFAQTTDNKVIANNFGGAVNVTNNGISFIPTFSLGKPAVIFDMVVGRKLSFEPQFRFSLEGKPWSFLFWWRYKVLRTEKFFFNTGAHLGLAYKTIDVSVNGETKDVQTVNRYLAGELSPNYLLTKNISIGMYYLYSRGIDPDATRNTHFLTLNANFSELKLSGQYFVKFVPQVYYLRMNQYDGYYFTSSLTLAKRKSPFSISGMFNKIIQTDISASKNFVWNASLVYRFNKKL
jgi:hypothetical protein